MARKKAVGYTILYLAVFVSLFMSTSVVAKHFGLDNIDITVSIYKSLTIVVLALFLFFQKKNIIWYCRPRKMSRRSTIEVTIYSFLFVGALFTVIIGITSFFVDPSTMSPTFVFWSWGTFQAVLIAPITEEILFRGVIYNTLKEGFSVKTSLIVQAILFGLIHINPIQISYTIIVGIVFGWLYEKYQSFWAVIIAHIILNYAGRFLIPYLQKEITPSFLGLVGLGAVLAWVYMTSTIMKKKPKVGIDKW